MRKLLFILLVILVSGCAQQGIQEAEPIDSKTDIQADEEWTGEIYFKQINPRVKGEIISEDQAQFTMTYSKKNNDLSGSGQGQLTWTESGECTGQKTWDYDFDVSGRYLSSKDTFIWSVGTVDSAGWKLEPNCVGRLGKAYVGSRVVSPDIPNWLSDIYFELYDGEIIEETVDYQDGGSVYYKMVLSSKLAPIKDFDFDVDVDPPIVTIKQGETAKATVAVREVRGNPGPITLTVTDWSSQNINAWFDKSPLSVGDTTTLHIQTSCDTPPDEYLFTAQGEAGIKSSVDSVTVNVVDDPGCKG